MLTFETLILFFTASVALGLAPGPDNIFVLTQSALNGRKAGLQVTLGLCTGLLVHTSIVAVGVAAIFQTSDVAFNLLKLAGAGYLVYLAIMSFRAGASEISAQQSDGPAAGQMYLRGIIMNITNPKVAIFFLAFLPQFTSPEAGSIPVQVMQLGALFMLATLLVFGSIAWFSGFLGDWLKGSPSAQVVLNRLAGTVFIGLAIRLALSER